MKARSRDKENEKKVRRKKVVKHYKIKKNVFSDDPLGDEISSMFNDQEIDDRPIEKPRESNLDA